MTRTFCSHKQKEDERSLIKFEIHWKSLIKNVLNQFPFSWYKFSVVDSECASLIKSMFTSSTWSWNQWFSKRMENNSASRQLRTFIHVLKEATSTLQAF